MPVLNLKPTHKIVTHYYKAVTESGQLSLLHEGAVAPHFAALLRACASPHGWSLQEQYHLARKGQNPLRLDGVLLDGYGLRHGVWEAKDSDDDLQKEARAKFRAGYPAENILFQSPTRALLYQDGKEVADEDITQPERLVEILKQFFAYEPPEFEQWEEAVAEFKDKVPELAQSLLALIEKERKENKRFVAAFDDFAEVARQAVNPNISTQAVEEMLIQHLLTERIFRKVFNNPDFAQRNIIAREIEKVITALTSRSFSREAFLGRLDRFYVAIETTAATIDNYREKQTFLNTVYEQFFQGFSVKVADTHGIVYTPQAIVDFMVRSVDDILRREFGKPEGLAADGVAILDPFVGTGNFILRAMREMPKTKLPKKYREELFCNEVMLLPYYIASMNIEHEYYELTGSYEPFEGIALVDTFELAESKQLGLFVKENTQRVQRQKDAPIFVIIGNPPYNAGQVNENDNNKNRRYPIIDESVSETYGKASRATLLRKLNDPYVKAYRWASDRIGDGVIAFITNSSFVSDLSFDGMRKSLQAEFDEMYILDLGGNVRQNPKLSGTTHNVFGIQVGVSINILIRNRREDVRGKSAIIHYARVDEFWRREQKTDYLERVSNLRNVDWLVLPPDNHGNWLNAGINPDFDNFVPLVKHHPDADSIFASYALGISTNRDNVVYDFERKTLTERVIGFIDTYNAETLRIRNRSLNRNVDDLVNYGSLKWSSTLKNHVMRGTLVKFEPEIVRAAYYRPFSQLYVYYDQVLIDRPSHFATIFPNEEQDNRVICLRTKGNTKPFHCLMSSLIPDLHLTGDSQCFPFYTYNEDGTNRRENITDWALARFREVYEITNYELRITNEERAPDSSSRRTTGVVTPGSSLDKWDIFHYIYALLHHPAYRETYAANLRRELPRIPFVRDFWAYARAGARLAEIHIHYEQQPEYPLRHVETPGEPLNWRVEKMRLSKDKTQIRYNDFLTLDGIPAAAFDYRLGNRSALDWIIDQYQVKTDKRSGITNDPNRADDPEYIVRLIKQVIAVSLETVEIVAGLPEWEVLEEADSR